MNETVCNIPSDSTTITRVKVSAIFLVGTIAVVLNSFIIIVALKYTIRTNLTHLIVNMAIADILVVLMGYFYEAAPLLKFKHFFANTDIAILDNIMCRTFTFVKHTSRLVTLSSLLIISVERFRATRPTMQAPISYSMKRRIVILGCSWGIPMLFSGFGLFAVVKRKTFIACNVSKLDTWKNIQSFAVVVTCLALYALNLTSLKRLRKPQAIVAHLSEEQAQIRLRRTSRAVKMVIFSLILYTTYYPLFFYKIAVNFVLSGDKEKRNSICFDWSSFTFVLRFLPLVNSCLSPFVYLAFLKDFQEGAKKMFCGYFTRPRNQIKHQLDQMTRETNPSKNSLNREVNLRSDVENNAM